MKTIDDYREPASWIVKDRETGKVLFETFEKPQEGDFTAQYDVIGIGAYLASLNTPKPE